MTEDYVFYVRWERVPVSDTLYRGKVKRMFLKIINNAQSTAWELVTKTFFKMVNYKPTKDDYKEFNHRVWQDGTEKQCAKLLKAFVSVEPESLTAIKSKFARIIPMSAKKQSRMIKKEYETGEGKGIERLVDALSHVMIFMEYGVCKKSSFPSSLKGDPDKE